MKALKFNLKDLILLCYQYKSRITSVTWSHEESRFFLLWEMLQDIFPSEEKANNILQNYVNIHFTKIKSVCSDFYFLYSISQSKENKENHHEVKIWNRSLPLPHLSHFHVLPKHHVCWNQEFLAWYIILSKLVFFCLKNIPTEKFLSSVTGVRVRKKPHSQSFLWLWGHLAIEPVSRAKLNNRYTTICRRFEKGNRTELKMRLVLSKKLKAQASKQFSHFLRGLLGDLGYFWGQTGKVLRNTGSPHPFCVTWPVRLDLPCCWAKWG